MRVGHLGEPGEERVVLAVADGSEDSVVDVSDVVPVLDARAIAGGALDRLRPLDLASRPRVDVGGLRWAPPVLGVGKVVCVGLNYADHARESGAAPPAEPILFMKDPSTIVGAHDDVFIPPSATKVDWEVELGIVIGAEARYLASPEDARACVAGAVVSHDVSERAFQLERGGQWDKGKSCERFNPLGPWLVTLDEIPDLQDLPLWLDVNGERRQDGTTADMIFGVLELVHYVSQFMVLRPGDLINTGTPAGVGLGMDPPRYLVDGDVVSLGVDGLGSQTQRFVPAPLGTAHR